MAKINSEKNGSIDYLYVIGYSSTGSMGIN